MLSSAFGLFYLRQNRLLFFAMWSEIFLSAHIFSYTARNLFIQRDRPDSYLAIP
jgi:hypothetical protein